MDNRVNQFFMTQSGAAQYVKPKGQQQEKKDMGHDLQRSFNAYLEDAEEKEEGQEAEGGKKKTVADQLTEAPVQEESNEIVEGKQTKEEEKKEAARNEDAQNSATNTATQAAGQMSQMMAGSASAIQALMLKNRDAMSLSEKRLTGLDRLEMFKRMDVDINEFNKMLARRGLTMDDLKMEQLLQLSRRNSREQVTSYLDFLAAEKRAGRLEKWEQVSNKDNDSQMRNDKRHSDEAQAQAQPQPVAMQPNVSFQQVFQTPGAGQQERIEKAEKQKEMVNEIIKHIDVKNVQNRTEILLKLNPQFMGDIQLKLTYEEDKVNAFFETTSKAAREMLSESIDDLTEGFRSKGIKLDKAQVKLVDMFSSEEVAVEEEA